MRIARGEKLFHLRDLVRRQKSGIHFVDADLRCDGLGRLLPVAGQHDRLRDAHRLHAADSIGRALLYRIGDHDASQKLTVPGGINDGSGILREPHQNVVLQHERRVAEKHLLPVHQDADAVTRRLMGLADAAVVQILAIRCVDGPGDRMGGVTFPVGRQLQKLLLREAAALGRVHRRDRKLSLGQGPGLVEDDGVHLGDGFEIVAALHQDADLRSGADAAEEAQRDRDHQGAGAGNDQENACPVDPSAEGLAQHQRRNQRKDHRRKGHAGCVPAGKAGDEVLEPRLFLAGGLHKLQDLRHRGIFIGLGGADPERSFAVHAAADHCVPGMRPAGHRLARQRRRVQERLALQDLTVQRDPLAGPDHDHTANLDLVRVHLLHIAVCLQVCEFGGDAHHVRDGLAGLAHRVALEELADLVEQHDGAGFGVLADTEGRDGRHHHQEFFIEHVPVPDVLQGAQQDVISHDQVGHREQRPRRDRETALQRRKPVQPSRLLKDQQREKEHCGDQNPPQHFFLLFCHVRFRPRIRPLRAFRP